MAGFDGYPELKQLRVVRDGRIFLAAVSLMFGMTAMPAAAQALPPLQPADIFDLELANDPQISPDGSQIAYVRIAADKIEDEYKPTVWVVNADGTGSHALTEIGDKASSPRWSPDGTKMAFTAMRAEGPVIVVKDMSSGEETELKGFVTPPSNLAWSPDGRQIAFAMFVPKAPMTIGSLVTAPEGAKWKPAPTVIESGYYRADGMGYIPAGQMHLFVIPAEGGEPHQVTRADSGYPPFTGRPFTWSPDSKSLLAALIHKSELEILHGAMFDTGIFRFPVDGGEPETLTDLPGPEAWPSLSPDGRYLAYTGFEDPGTNIYDVAQLTVLDLKTGKRQVLSADLDRDVDGPQWSPDGSGIYGFYVDHGVTKLALFDLKGKRKVLAEDLGMAHTAYSAEPSYSVSKKGIVAYQSSTVDTSGNISVVGGKIKEARRVTDLNMSLFAGRTLGRVEKISYTSSAGDLPVEGWIIYPPGFDPSKKYPLILEIHGGPTANYGERFDMEKQLMAAAGYVVFYPNVRGSTGYGAAYGNLINDDYPGLEFNDLMSGVDAVLAKGFIDPEQLYVTGGSGGGTLTAWLISKSDRFRAAAVLYPVIEWQSQALTSDILPIVFKGFFHGTPWNQAEEYARRSLLKNVADVVTPTLVMTGESDYRTPISQSEQYYAALKYFGVESVFVRVPLENHGIRMFPSHFASKIAIVTGWFDTHKDEAAGSGAEVVGVED